MKKIAIFVEGQTEVIFVKRFLYEYINPTKIELYFEEKGRDCIIAKGIRKNLNAEYFFLIYNVTGDGNIFSAVKERAQKLIVKTNYSYLLALRDLYPKKREEKNAVIRAFNKIVESIIELQLYDKKKIQLILAIMEIEAWFLADVDLFLKIYPSLTHDKIIEELKINLKNDNPEMYDHPAEIVSKIYDLVDQTYGKHETDSYRIAYNINYDYLLGSEDVLNKVKSLKYFIDCIDESVM
ncbi:DUF4276 family protein [Candidatus Magnetominusculus xianensis]|uniref:DUF4276 family protein n=1 Tax=Candidatus Magnetominusculus xianensis TaxID=1748249 RepID=A0ABR5SIK4_9BACT|nr:DUF4276 family protein [Candidatus Magnetominusculus xianensis]KWT84932.1 hypothetical protein ASN18_1862 [Candidatus Magnetominusculus xianensis]MBF0404486.1 DUF4276 family protein [Nitrospirota bacterium]